MVWARTENAADDRISLYHGKEMYFLYGESPGSRISFVGEECRLSVIRRESWQMSQVREPLPPGPGGPEQAPTENSSLIFLPREKTDQENTVAGDKDINQPSSNQSIQAEIQEQSIWGNRTDGDLITSRAQRIIVNGVTSDSWPVTSGVPQGSILGPVLFNIFINYLDVELEGILSKFAADTKLRGAVDSFRGREALQRELDKLEDWAITKHLKFNKGKYWILQLGWGHPGCLHRLGNEILESSAIERDLGVLVDSKLNMNQQCPGSQEGQLCPGGIWQSITSWSREGIVPLCSALVWPHLAYCVQFWAPQYKKSIKTSRECAKEGNKDGEGP
ncbi:hypothetical protein BTVI_37861 [Pitangus sulphuratus]|nr:hypothetical protein BTVI_37861 [Pitangus sulphuratus]